VSFQWPLALWALLALPLLVALYFWLLRHRRKTTLRLSSLTVARAALGAGPGWRRHVPPALLLIALTLLALATARPTMKLLLPQSERTVILAIDVSLSMRAEDIKPNRLVAAQEAAKAFVQSVPRDVKVGIVAFAGTAALVQPPTTNRDDLIAAIDRLQLQRATATGSAIIVALATLFPAEGIDTTAAGGRASPYAPFAPLGGDGAPPRPTPVEPGSYKSAAIIMLTDGQRTTGPDPLQAAAMAADHGVRIYAVGLGTKEGAVIGFDGWSMRVRLDEATLKDIAAFTQGQYFFAGTADDLKKVYGTLSGKLVVERQTTELSAVFAALAALLTVLAAGLSLWWFGRVA